MDASDVCLNCGASAFEEEDGLYFCTVCQTQRQGRTQEVLHDFESQNIESGEVSQKRKKKEISTGILWTTTEAFNHVLLSQVHALIDTQLVSNEFKQTVLTIWCCYLKYCEIAFVENGKNITPKLHPAARFRDVQITRNRCTQVPLYKNARSSSPKRRRLRFGNRVLQVHNLRDESMSDLSDEEVTRKYTSAPLRKTVSQRLFSTDIRRQIRDVVYGDYEAFSEFIETDTSDEDENLTTRYKKLKTLYNSGYLTNTKHIHSSSDCFIGILTLPKTIALLNLAMRLSNENIFTGDLLQLINKGCIPYFNALLTFPKDWKVLSTDCRTFVPTSSPTFQNIDTLTVKLANAIKINYLPSFNLIPLIERYVNDLNLPSDIVRIMHFQNVFETEIFSKMLTKKVSEMKRLPPLETIALMSIVLMLKRLFGLDGKCEYFLSRVAEKSSSNFIWKDWEQYSRLRLDCLKSYYLPLHNQ
ncbi:TATA box-binding protein-associated factor RNA polymerase I subunit B-like protein [Leptotrombidium deliense]|uniref:TATA box-binding protein-associated factor RNA polymerase I subunit B-like protein n=1 Tax=Leptotrombidium deliense TaxID=299467 RepID=A0A443SGN3_9ACAR|nr:TATA box-binding protein-associated factor RNA polymerase I subunit B-like protein [Leptotrombidium deliense]